MNIKLFSLSVTLVGATVAAPAQTSTSSTTATTALPTASAPLQYSLVEIGPNHRVWEAPTATSGSTNALAARAATRARHRVVELASGMNYWNGQAWAPSQPAFEAQANGFVASKAYLKVQLAAQLNTVGAVSTSVSNGPALTSTPVAIVLYDPVSGQSVTLAGITNSVGVLVSSNQVLFASALSGDVSADVLVTLRADSCQQDVILHTSVNPADYGLSDKSRIQVLTELYGAPAPEAIRHPITVEQDPTVRQQMASPDLVDNTLTFGQMTFGAGRAYFAPNGLTNAAPVAPVAKDLFTTPDGRTFLRESVRCSDLKRALQALPPKGTHASVTTPKRGTQTLYAVIPRPNAKARRRAPGKLPSPKLAQVALRQRPSVVIDYVEITGDYDSYVFSGDTTYFISGPAYVGEATIEGGTVLKYAPGAFLQVTGDLTLETSSYRVAVFSAADDDSVGESLRGVYSGYTGNPSGNTYAAPALWFPFPPSGVALSNTRFCYAASAVEADICWDIQVSHSQFVHCVEGIILTGSAANVRVNNCLFSNTAEENATALEDESDYNTWALCNCTVDGSANYLMVGSSSDLTCLNCIIANSADAYVGDLSGENNGFYNADSFGDGPVLCAQYPFQAVGAGNYYLADGSPCRDTGTTNIDAALLADLAKRTTYPPLDYSNAMIVADTTLAPQAQRDTDVPDLGYHYAPIDYFFSQTTLSNATLTLLPGVCLGVYPVGGPVSTALWIASGGSLQCLGNASSPVYVAQQKTVQEEPFPIHGNGDATLFQFTHGTPLPQISCLFTKFCGLAGEVQHFYGYACPTQPAVFQNCEFLSGNFNTYQPSVCVTNCLFDRTSVTLEEDSAGFNLSFGNNLFHGGSLNLSQANDSMWFFRDNLFDGTGIANYSDPISPYDLCHNNAYAVTTDVLFSTNGPGDINLTSAFTYVPGPLGNYYQPSGSPLIDKGSTAANLLGLYHYTTQTNLVNNQEVPEGTTTVDLGYHYVAVDGNGNPLDFDHDGIADYIEDVNGDGIGSNDPTNWQIYDSVNGLTTSSALLVFTPLK